MPLRTLFPLLVLPALLAFAPAPMTPKQPRQFSNSLGMKLVLIPAGKFAMGSAAQEPRRGENEVLHEVEITKPFYLGAYEVTQKQFREIMGWHPSHFSTDGRPGPRHSGETPAAGKDMVKGMNTDDFPVDNVSYEEALEFCKRLSSRPAERRAGRVYRLPSEAEWEYACRAGTRGTYHHGATLENKANFAFVLKRTTRVGSYKPNAWGLYDMHGNVAEWCADWYDESYYRHSPRRDPAGPAAGTSRVFRGGSWRCSAANCRAAYRFYFGTRSHDIGIGFRVALDTGRGR